MLSYIDGSTTKITTDIQNLRKNMQMFGGMLNEMSGLPQIGQQKKDIENVLAQFKEMVTNQKAQLSVFDTVTAKQLKLQKDQIEQLHNEKTTLEKRLAKARANVTDEIAMESMQGRLNQV